MYDIIALGSKELSEIRVIAKEFNIPKVDKLEKQDLIYKILDYQALNPTPEILNKEKQDQVKPFRGRPRKELDAKSQEPRVPRESIVQRGPKESKQNIPAEEQNILPNTEPRLPREQRQPRDQHAPREPLAPRVQRPPREQRPQRENKPFRPYQ